MSATDAPRPVASPAQSVYQLRTSAAIAACSGCWATRSFWWTRRGRWGPRRSDAPHRLVCDLWHADQSLRTVLRVTVAETPGWVSGWCEDHLGSTVTEVLFSSSHMSSVFGVRLDDGRGVVVKARPDPRERVDSCLQAQAHLADGGFPCARPLTPAITVGGLTVHAETHVDGGHMLRGASPSIAARYATAYAWLMSLLEAVEVPPPLPNPHWLGWQHPGTGLWPSAPWLDERDQRLVPDFVVDTAERSTRRLQSAQLPNVVGHGDFEAQNLRWSDDRLLAVHDWDSLAWFPEAALVGAAAGSFASADRPTLAPLESSEAFLIAYQDCRQRRFSREEGEIAWAASLWPAVHNARGEALFAMPPDTTEPLAAQAFERLKRANA
jgi:hypothetical protein